MEVSPSVAEIFKSMEYGSIIDGSSLAKDWLNGKQGVLASFIGGKLLSNKSNSEHHEVKDHHSSGLLAHVYDATQEDLDDAVKSSRAAFGLWNRLSPYARARHLYNIARHLQKHVTLLAQVEALIRGVQIRDPRECDVPGVIRTFYHHAGWAQVANSEFAEWSPRGVVVGITSWVTPLQSLAWLVAPALASGCTVILKPSRHAAPVALLLAELCSSAGLPNGVLNVVTGASAVAAQLVTHINVAKVTFFGSTEVGRLVRDAAEPLGKSLTLMMSSRTPMIVLESADIDSACEALIESAWFNQGQVPWAVTDVYVQQPVYNKFVGKLKNRMLSLKLGHNFEKMADIGYPCNPKTAEAVQALIKESKMKGHSVLSIPDASLPSPCKYVVPAVIVGGSIESNVLTDDVWPLPVVMLKPFRTAKEAASLANSTRYSLASSIWTEDFSLAEEVALSLKVGTVWINCVNKFDPGVPFGASRHSGFGRIGGREGMLEFLTRKDDHGDPKAVGVGAPSTTAVEALPKVERTYKLYYGGGHKRPDGNSYYDVLDSSGKAVASVPEGSRKDIRNAVEAAQKGQPGWNKSGPHLRAQILFYFAENLELRSEEFAKELSRVEGKTEESARRELELCVECLFFWASVCDKNPIASCAPPPFPESKAAVSITYEPHGVIGIICPASTSPLLAAISILAPAIALGNAVVMVSCKYQPLPVFWLCQVADTSDIPAGVINVISGNFEVLGATLADHHDVNALWCREKLVDVSASSNMKPAWWWTHGVNFSGERQRASYHADFFFHSTLSKAVWKPIGGMFGN